MGLFHKHRLMIIETIDIHQEWRSRARCDSMVVDKYTKCTNEKFSKTECQDEDPAETGVVDVIEVWMESMRCIDNVQFYFSGAKLYKCRG